MSSAYPYSYVIRTQCFITWDWNGTGSRWTRWCAFSRLHTFKSCSQWHDRLRLATPLSISTSPQELILIPSYFWLRHRNVEFADQVLAISMHAIDLHAIDLHAYRASSRCRHWYRLLIQRWPVLRHSADSCCCIWWLNVSRSYVTVMRYWLRHRTTSKSLT